MKSILFVAVMAITLASCGDNTADNTGMDADSSSNMESGAMGTDTGMMMDTGSMMSTDTSSMGGAGMGAGTGSAGSGKDSLR